MKDKPLTAAMTMKALANSEYIKRAFADVGEGGIGSIKAAKAVRDLICGNEWHAKRLLRECEDWMRKAAAWAGAPLTQEATNEFYGETMSGISTVASVYMLMGIAVGVLAAKYVQDEKESHAA